MKRAYEPVESTDEVRVRGARLSPQGVTKERLQTDEWCRKVAPSLELRRWFDRYPKRWLEFRRRYFVELRADPDAWRPLGAQSRRARVTLIYAVPSEAVQRLRWRSSSA